MTRQTPRRGPVSPRLPSLLQMLSGGNRNLAQYKPWLRGRIGWVERGVYHALHRAQGPLSTGKLVREVYLGQFGRSSLRRSSVDAPPPKVQQGMYLAVRRAAQTYATRIGRAETQGRPVLWVLKPPGAISDLTVRALKTERTHRRAKFQAR
jgi:hypothetical protein